MEAGLCSLCHRTQAKFACSCVIPATPICEVCIATHLGTEGTHMPVPIKKPQVIAPVPIQGNEVCDDCRGKAAINFCLCSNPVRKRCQDCDFAHYQKAPNTTHSKHPITAYSTVARVTVETFRKKQQYICDLELYLGEELTQFDTFVNQVKEEFEALIWEMTAMKETFLQNLLTERVKLTTALGNIHQAIETKRYEVSLEVVTNLDDYVANGFKDLQEYNLNMFTGKLELQGMRDLLSKAVTFTLTENHLFEEIIYDIPVIKGNNLRLYDSNSYQLTQRTLSQTPRIDNSTAYCYIKGSTVLCCGGANHNEVYEVNVQNGTVVQAPSMHQKRRLAGIFNLNGKYVLLFGGCNPNLSSVEKFDLGRKLWTELPPMQVAKKLCSVCQHSNGLYISGYSDSTAQTTIELFNTLNETCILLHTVAGFSGILCCAGDELYHIRLNLIEVGKLTSGQTSITFTQKGTIPQVCNGIYWLCFPASVIGGKVVGVLTAGETPCGLFSFKPATVQFSHVVNIAY